MQSIRILTIASVLLTAAFTTGVQANDAISEKLEKAKEKHAGILERTDKQIEIQIDRADTQARLNGSPADVQSILFQKDRFEKHGLVPALCDASVLKQRLSSHERLLQAYRIAIRDLNKAKLDAEATAVRQDMEPVWPAFLDQPESGGWNPIGSVQMEVSKGVLALSSNGARAGILSANEFQVGHILNISLSASENAKAWVGIRIRNDQNKYRGYTSSIIGKGDSYACGKMGHDFDVNEIGVQSVIRKPNEFVDMKFAFDQSKSITNIVDGNHNGGMASGVEPIGKIGVFVTEGTVVIKSISIEIAPN